MISFKVLVARGPSRAASLAPLRARHKAAMVLLVLLALLVVVALFLAFAVVGLVVAVPALIVALVLVHWRKRKRRREVVGGVLEVPAATSSEGRRARALPGGERG